ncbi:MAG TPA: response regulator transcription factor [Desulfosporosinus sp.]|nr:response regulator transcription factor [Desulfosporosinus sp.]
MVTSSDNAIRLLVVDDHILFAEGTVSLLSSVPYISVVATAKNGRDCLEIVTEEHPDVILLDINLPDYCGTDLIEKIKAIDSKASIIMLTGQDPAGYVNASLKKGAQGFLLKDCSKAEMITAILQASKGELYISQDNKIHGTSLTPQEIEIIELIAQGASNGEIACTLGIKNRTIDTQVNDILLKLGATSRLEALLLYIQGKVLRSKIN